jgi:hypothetical protein
VPDVDPPQLGERIGCDALNFGSPQNPLLTRHLIEIFIIEDEDDPAVIEPSPPVWVRNWDGPTVGLHLAQMATPNQARWPLNEIGP